MYITSVLLEPIKRQFHVSDTMLGLLSGLCFAVLYGVFGLPVARWADRGDRRLILTLTLTLWSAMTVLCGLAQTFGQLALARLGVGAGEAGAVPAAQSLIADYFPPAQRAVAYSVFTAAATAGYFFAIGVGGYVAARNGWRVAFVIAGLPGLGLALVTHIGLREPRRTQGFPDERQGTSETLGETLSRLIRKRSFILGLVGFVLYNSVVSGALVFIPSFIVRVLRVELSRASLAYGGIVAVGSLIGTLGSGWIAGRLSVQDMRWLAWCPAVACILAALMFITALSMTQFRDFLVWAFGAWIVLGGTAPLYAAVQAVCGSSRRAIALAIVLFLGLLLGGGLGPVVTGAISDVLSRMYGTKGLQYAIVSMMSVLLATGGLFYLFGCAMPRDLED